jgi:hypothetical protein
MRDALARGGDELDREGEPYEGDRLTDEEALAQFAEDFKSMANSTVQMMGEHTVSLPISYFNCSVAPADFPSLATWSDADTDAVEALLQARVDRYADTYLANIIRLGSDEDATVNIGVSNYYHGPTLFSKSVDYLSFNGETRSVSGMVKRETVEEILADYLEDARDELWFLPTIDFNAETELFDTLEAASEGDFGGDSPEPDDEIEEMAFNLLKAMMQDRGQMAAAELISGGHPRATDVLAAVSAVMRAMSAEEPPDPAELMVALVQDDDVDGEIAAAVMQMMMKRAAELGAAGEEGGEDEDTSEVEEMAFQLLAATMRGDGEKAATDLLSTGHEDAPEVMMAIGAVLKGFSEGGRSGDPQAVMNSLGEAEVSPRIRTAVVKMMMNRSDDLSQLASGGGGGKSGCMSVLIAGFVLIWQYLF